MMFMVKSSNKIVSKNKPVFGNFMSEFVTLPWFLQFASQNVALFFWFFTSFL